MRVPIRKPGISTPLPNDPHLTPAKFQELQAKLIRLKSINRPREAEEVKRLALMGDFSENAGYQLAKGRLRGLNQRILDLENLLARAEIIEPSNDRETVQLGNFVTLKSGEQEITYQILGSVETNPGAGIISHNSPLGSALLHCRIGETIIVELRGRTKEYKILKIF